MADAKPSDNSRTEGASARTPRLPGPPRTTRTSTQADLAMLQAKSVLGPQINELAAQMALPASKYRDLLSTMSISRPLAQFAAANRTALGNLAVHEWTNNSAMVGVIRDLSKSPEVHHESAISKVLGNLAASGVLTHAAEYWAAERRKLLTDLNVQWPALSCTVVSDIARPANDALIGKMADLIKGFDVGLAGSFALQNAASTAAARSLTLGLSEQLRSAGAVAPGWWKVVQGLQLADGLGSVARLTALSGPMLRSSTLAAGIDSYASVQGLLGDLARGRDDALLHGRSLLPATALNSYLDSLGTRPRRRRTELAGLVGNATTGLLLGESLTAELHDDGEILVGAATTQLIEPWQEAFDDTRSDLFVALERLSPNLADLLRGAWFNIKTNGPAAASSAANCLVEVLDQTLHALVDESSLPGWLADSGHVGQEYLDASSGRPTRRARLAYVLQTRSKRDAQLLRGLEAGLAASLSPLHDQLESAKHGRVDIGVQVIRCHAVAVEGFLINLLLGGA